MPYYEAVRCAREGGIAYLTLQRPQRGNPVDRQLAGELAELCDQIEEDDDLRLVILTGMSGVFSRGEDLAELVEGDYRYPPPALCSEALASLTVPTIAAINGDALGAGLELALACDLRLAVPEARLGLPQVAWGLIPCGGGTQRLSRLVGRGRALGMTLTADLIDAEEALRLGLVSRVVPETELLPAAQALARRIFSRAPIAVRYAKEAVLKGLDLTLEQGLRLEADLSILLQTTADRDEGIRAFQEKREPHFRGE